MRNTKYHMHLNRFYLDNRKMVSPILTTATKKMPGGPRLFDEPAYYKVRYTVERFFAWTENFRKLAIRYGRLPGAFSGLFHLACTMILWRVLRWLLKISTNATQCKGQWLTASCSWIRLKQDLIEDSRHLLFRRSA
ncbi:MAG: transposase [Nitrososphaerota archaeon]|nr:transposase [Nitrososphaerota archaeon]